MNGLRKLLPLIGALLLTVGVVGSTTLSENRKKARYYYMAAVEAQMQEQNDAAYEYYKRAHTFDPENAEAASAYAIQRLMIESDTFQNHEAYIRGLEMMKPFVDKYPGDFFESSYYAYLAANFDTLPEAIRIYERAAQLFPKKTFLLPRLAESYMANGQLDSALSAIDRYEKAEGPSIQLSLTKIGYLLTRRDTAAALQESERLLAFNPRSPEYLLNRANILNTLVHPDSGLVYMQKAEEIAPDNGAVKISLAYYYQNKGDSLAYDEKFYEALLCEDLELDIKTRLMDNYFSTLFSKGGDTKRGDHLFETLRKQYPHEPQVLDLSARYSAAKNDVKTAREEMAYAIDLDPENEEYRMMQMRYFLADSLYDDAIKVYDEAAKRFRPSSEMTMLMSVAASLGGNHQRALQAMDTLISDYNPELKPFEPFTDRAYIRSLNYNSASLLSDYLLSAGDIAYQQHRLDSAYTAYDNALLFNPYNSMALNNYAYFLAENDGDLNKAEQMSKAALEEDKTNPTFIDTYAWILFKLRRYEEALEYQTSAVELSEAANDTSSELYDHFGDILFKNGEVDKAVENWQKALDLEPDNALIKKKIKQKTYLE